MIPRTLTLSGFLSYRAPVVIDFTPFDLACIAGANGAGKSSLLDAITWALFGQARKRDESLINIQSDAAQVTFEFEYENNLYRVQRTNRRGKSTMLEFQIAKTSNQYAAAGSQSERTDKLNTENRTLNTITWKPLTERRLRETQARIEETLRLDYDTFVNAAFFLQGKADQFTQQTPAKRKAILSNILGLEIWETYRKNAAERRKSVESEIANLDGRLHEISVELAEEDARRARLKNLRSRLEDITQARVTQETALENMQKVVATLNEQRKLVDALARQLNATTQRVNELTARRRERTRERDAFAGMIARAAEIRAAHQAWQDARARLAEWDETAARFREHEQRRNEPLAVIREERARLETDRDSILKQQINLNASLSERPGIQADLDRMQAAMAETQAQLEKRAALETDLRTAIQQQANAKAENPRLRDAMNELKARIDQLEETGGVTTTRATCPLCGQSLLPEDRARLIEDLRSEGKEMGDRYRANAKLLKEANERVRNLKSKIANLKSADTQRQKYTARIAHLAARIEQIENQKKEWEETQFPLLAAVRIALAEEDFAHEAREALARIDAELKEIGYDAAAHDKIRRAEKEGRTSEEQVRALERAEAALEPLKREIAGIQSQMTSYQKELEKQRGEYDTAAASLAAAQSQAPDIRQAQRDLLNVQERENRIRMQVGGAQQDVDVLKSIKSRRKILGVERESLAQKVSQYKQLERAFGKDGVPALLIEQALPQIETKANKILDRLSGGDMNIRFQTQRELKTRPNLKETLGIQISDRAGIRDYELYSGGESLRVSFAIRLALSEILAQRAGARLQTLVIDEGFGSQDAIGRQRLIEAINMVRPDFAKILVITHIESLKDVFPTRLEVEKGEMGSVVRVV
ncbi:MAG: AAA family ATPase [Anaerolineales bacterium]